MDALAEFKKIAPYIATRVKERITDGMTDSSIMKLVHAEIMEHFANQQQMFMRYMAFNEAQKANFAVVMYDLTKPLAKAVTPDWNPKYLEYVKRTGKSGALNYMTGR